MPCTFEQELLGFFVQLVSFHFTDQQTKLLLVSDSSWTSKVKLLPSNTASSLVKEGLSRGRHYGSVILQERTRMNNEGNAERLLFLAKLVCFRLRL